MAKKSDIIFISLARNQSRFFCAVGEVLAHAGHSVFHVCFHEGAVRELRARGCKVFNPFERQPANLDEVRFDDFGIVRPELLLCHEKAAYELRDTAALVRKFKGHLGAMKSILDELEDRGRPMCMIQELGGFTSVLAAYYAARRLGIDNWFVEPSFFRGRLFFTPNTFAAPKIPDVIGQPSAEVVKIIGEIVDSREVVIPSKDRLHYRSANKKLLDFNNIRRLVEKLAAKYIHDEREEFQYVFGHVIRHLKMFLNSWKLARFYHGLPSVQPFIYYPLHVPADFALTIRSPEYLDQYSLIDYLCRVAPLGYRVVIKEHPALVGGVSPARVLELVERHDNLIILPPTLNNHTVLAAADVVITVNSKSGAEALLHGTSVVVLGNAFYENCPLVHRAKSIRDLPEALGRALELSEVRDDNSILKYFQAVWEASSAGELYDLNQLNVERFASSLCRYIVRK